MPNLETGGNNITGSASYFEGFDKITVSASDVTSAVTLTLSGSGALDLTDELAIAGGGARAASVYASAAGNNITSGAGDDFLYGSSGTDTLNGGAGNDFIDSDANGAGGTDVLIGGAGNDTLSDYNGAVKAIDGGADNDKIYIGFNDNPGDGTLMSGTVAGGSGNDLIFVNGDISGLTISGVETLVTNGGTVTASAVQFESFNQIIAYDGEDPLYQTYPVSLALSGSGSLDLTDELAITGGGSRAATVFASAAGNSITTGAGNDVIYASGGTNSFDSGAGDDFLYGSSGSDTLNGGAGNDFIDSDANGAGGTDVLIGGAGNDTLSDYNGAVKAIDGGADNDKIYIGFNDNPGDGTLMSGTVAGGSGNDLIFVNGDISGLTISGVETLVTNGGTVTASAAQFESFNQIIAYDGEDPLYQTYPVSLALSGSGSLDLTDELAITGGGSRAATVFASAAGNSITTGAGNDVIYASGGTNSFDSGAGDDFLYGSSGSDTLNGGAGNDFIDSDSYGAGGTDVLIGGSGNDTFYNYNGAVKAIDGGADNDKIYIGFNDNPGDGTLMSGTIAGGSGNDLVSVSAGDLGSLTFTSVETLITNGSVITGSAAQFESFSHIIAYEGDDPAYQTYSVSLALSGSGSLDLTDELAITGGGSRAAYVTASAAGNSITTGDGDDFLFGNVGADTLNGGAGNDTISDYSYQNLGDAGGNDVLIGGTGNDTIYDYNGAVKAIDGGADDDRIYIGFYNNPGDGTRISGTIAGGSGNDLLSVSGADLGALIFTGIETLVTNGGAITGSVSQFEKFNHIIAYEADGNETMAVSMSLSGGGALDLTDKLAVAGGGSRAATVVASSAGNAITTGSGDDLLYGDGGADTFNAGAGNDLLLGGEGVDTAIFSGAYGEYDLTDRTAIDGSFRISSVLDGTDNLFDVEFAQFTDGTYDFVNRIFIPSASSTTLETLGATVTKTVAQFEAYERIVTFDQPGSLEETVSLVVSDGGTLDLAGELEASRSVNIRASDFGNVLITGSKNDILSGGAGDDTLNGGSGSDRMYGLTGNDTFIVGSAGDVVIEYTNQGTDTVRSSVSYSLVSNVENLTLVGAESINGFGNSLANLLTGNDAGNTLSGANGNDELIGRGGDDTLDGGVGADRMAGGSGGDTYYVDTRGDTVIELAGEGSDTVYSAISYTLGDNIENGFLTGAAANTLTGNGADNALNGNSGANQLIGNAGNDSLDGAGGNDRMLGGLGDDVYYVDAVGDVVVELGGAGNDTIHSQVEYTLGAGVENLTLDGPAAIKGTGNNLANSIEGNDANNILNGGEGNDYLWGGYGNDRMIGGKGFDTMLGYFGDDTYVVDNSFERVVESAGSGRDKVEASVSFKLGANLEDLQMTGSAAIDGTGNYLANVIVGNGAANILNGFAGNDTLTGGAGQDTFLFDTALNARSNVDTITDFRSVDDTIRLDDAVFKGLSSGSLSASAFVVGSAATTAAHHIIYDNKTGVLYFDADGTGAGSQVAFAKLDGTPTLTASDVFVV